MAVKENKFIVLIIPVKDADEFFHKYQNDYDKLHAVQQHLMKFRISKGKKPSNQYIIVNQDEPYAEDVWEAILQGEEAKKRG